MTDAWTTGYDAGEREMARLVLVRCTAAGTIMLHESDPFAQLELWCKRTVRGDGQG